MPSVEITGIWQLFPLPKSGKSEAPIKFLVKKSIRGRYWNQYTVCFMPSGAFHENCLHVTIFVVSKLGKSEFPIMVWVKKTSEMCSGISIHCFFFMRYRVFYENYLHVTVFSGYRKIRKIRSIDNRQKKSMRDLYRNQYTLFVFCLLSFSIKTSCL